MEMVFPYAAAVIICSSIFGASCGLRKDNPLLANLLLLCSAIVFSFFVGLRAYSVGLDTIYYVNTFQIAREYSFFDFGLYSGMINCEPGFLLWTKLVGLLTADPTVFLVLTAFLQYMLLVIAIRKIADQPGMAFLLSLLLLDAGFYFYCNVLRQGFACAFLLWGVMYLIEGNKRAFVLLVVVAAAFHSASIIFLVLYIPALLRPTVRNYLVCCLALLLGIVVISGVTEGLVRAFMPRYSYYFDTNFNNEQIVGFGSVARLAISLYAVLGAALIIRKSSNEAAIAKAYYFGIIVLLGIGFLVMMQYIGVLERVSRYCYYFLPLALTTTLKNLHTDVGSRWFMSSTVLLITVILFIIRLEGGYYAIAPYISIL